MAAEERQWQYLTPAGDKRGPFPESTLMRMLVRGLPGLDSSTYCWTPGMEQWQPVGALQHFHALLTAQAAAWFYLDKDGNQLGPVNVQTLAKAFEAGEVDGLTMVWHAELPGGWKQLAEVEELRTLMRLLVSKNGDEEEEAAANGQAEEGEGRKAATTAGDMVFEGEEQPALPPEMMKKKEAHPKEEGKKSYVGEDGVRYRFNEGSGEWEEAPPGEESEEEEEEEEEGDGDGEEGEAPISGAGGAGEGGGGQQQQPAKRKRKKKKRSGWDKQSNKWVYITGLPSDVTLEELEAHFKQVGILAVDPETQQPRIKLYRDPMGIPKGDASIAYVRPESVELAIEILNGGLLRPGCPVTISKAVFQQKKDEAGQEPAKRRKVAEAKIKVARAAAKQALSWADEDDTGVNRSKALRIVVIKNMFHPRDAAKQPNFFEELEDDLGEECSRLGPIDKITVFQSHPEGVVIIKYGTAYAAEQCVKLMNARFFAGRKLQCSYWDGTTDYNQAKYVEPNAEAEKGGGVVVDEEAEEEARLEAFGEELDNQELPPEFALEVEGE